MVDEWKKLVGISHTSQTIEMRTVGVKALLTGESEFREPCIIFRERGDVVSPYKVSFMVDGCERIVDAVGISFKGGIFKFDDHPYAATRLPWLLPSNIQNLLGYVPDAISCLAGGVRIIRDNRLYPHHTNSTRTTPPSFSIGGDDYRNDISGTGAKARVMAATQLAKALPSMVIFTDATYSNAEQRESGIPYQAIIYEEELRRRNVKNPIIRLDEHYVINTFTEMVSLVKAVANISNLTKVGIITNMYHITRVEAFLDVVLRNRSHSISREIFRNISKKLGVELLTSELVRASEVVNNRGVLFHAIAAEKIIMAMENERAKLGWRGKPFTVLYSMVYPPQVPLWRALEADHRVQELLVYRRETLGKRLKLERDGNESILNGSYYS